jgi:hypothetical protein
MSEEKVGRLYSTQGVDWTDEDSIRTFSARVYASFTSKEK